MTAHTTIFADVMAGLRDVGYGPELIAEDYSFKDWFSAGDQTVSVDAAAFGETPVSYDSACLGVVHANGVNGDALINRCRSLGAPFVIEITNTGVREWAVSRFENKHAVLGEYSTDRVRQLFVDRGADWKPQKLLRSKNIGTFHWIQQRGLFDGLLPELEEHIQAKLDPLLKETLSETKQAYADSSRSTHPDEAELFKLVFWLLTAKVFKDRQVPGFKSLGDDSEDLIAAVSRHYGELSPPRLLNRDARSAAARCISSTLDFRNLSVEVLSQIWSSTLVDRKTRQRLGIHRTPRSIVRYIVDRIDFSQYGDDKRIVLEPCCGSAVFLIGAMNALRHKLFGATPSQRHSYFVKHLVGIEKDPFGIEISRLALTLADFPNPNGWEIKHEDVFQSNALVEPLRRAGVVLCNPPFEDFEVDERSDYQLSTPHKSAELLNRVLDGLHPNGVIGFVLPRKFIDGRGGYADVRRRVAERFANIEITLLPDKFFKADSELVLLIAQDPIPHSTSRLVRNIVLDNDAAAKQFELTQAVSSSHVVPFTSIDAESSFVVPELQEVWNFLVNYPALSEVASIHRGIEWTQRLTVSGKETGNRQDLVHDAPGNGYRLGVPPRAVFDAFQKPVMKYLSIRTEDMRGNAHERSWDKPKAIVNKSRRSRGKWRMVSFPDEDGIVCYQTFIGVWPESERFDAAILSALLNSPVANAFVYDHGGQIDINVSLIKRIPVPQFTLAQEQRLRSLIKNYQAVVEGLSAIGNENATAILTEIDAVVLDGFRMPAKLERQLLDFFKNEHRQTSPEFPDYFPAEEDSYYNLSTYISPEFKESTAESLLRRLSSH